MGLVADYLPGRQPTGRLPPRTVARSRSTTGPRVLTGSPNTRRTKALLRNSGRGAGLGNACFFLAEFAKGIRHAVRPLREEQARHEQTSRESSHSLEKGGEPAVSSTPRL